MVKILPEPEAAKENHSQVSLILPNKSCAFFSSSFSVVDIIDNPAV
jgi:hypothetical protein